MTNESLKSREKKKPKTPAALCGNRGFACDGKNKTHGALLLSLLCKYGMEPKHNNTVHSLRTLENSRRCN